MIDAAVIREIIAVYVKHGWTLRRVLLSSGLGRALEMETSILFAGAVIQGADIDAAWFSRDTNAGGTAWEIRHLSSAPFALVVVIDEKSGDFEDILLDTEDRLRETVGKPTTGH